MADDFELSGDTSPETGCDVSCDTISDFGGDLAADTGVDLNDDLAKTDGKNGAANKTLMSYIPPPPEFYNEPPAIVQYVEDSTPVKTPDQIYEEMQDSFQNIAGPIADALEAERHRREEENATDNG